MSHSTPLEIRLARELEHFEGHYQQEAAAGIEPVSDFDKQRYSRPPEDTIFPREWFYHLLAPLGGKEVLEIACGNGIDACLCAYNGAKVYAYDLSPNSIEMVRRRAAVNGLSRNVEVQVTGEFEAAFAGQKFDAIVGYAALHHLPLEGLGEKIHDRLRPGGVAVFAEPVANSRFLRVVRGCIPYRIHKPTEDERPLTDCDIEGLAKPFDRVVRREFQLVSRLWPIFPNNWPLAVGLHWLDYYLLKIPWVRRFATVAVFGMYRDG